MIINFESTTTCNSKCVFCPRVDMTRPIGTMSDDIFHSIIRQGKELGVKFYCPSLNGEPFIFPKIYEWISYMEREGVWTILYTNAENIDVDKILPFSNIHSIVCSVNAATKDTYKSVMRNKNFEKVEKNVKNLIDKAKFKVLVSMIVTNENFHEQQLFKNTWGRKAKINQSVRFPEWSRNRRTVRYDNRKRPCSRLLDQINVLWDGRVSLCCLDYDGNVILGNLKKGSLRSIVENKLEPLRKRHRVLDFDMKLCRDCDFGG